MAMLSIMKKNLLKILVLCIAICSAVCLFTACSGVEFKINFVVDGEIYATVNTNGAETIKMPDNPVKDDYTFDGWFWDKDTWAKPFTANSLLDTPLSSDMSVYCKWKEDASPMERAEIVSANGFTFDGTNGKISVSNDTETYSFINQIQVNAKATWVISTDIYGLQTVATKTIPLNIGDNTVYLLVTSGDGNNINLYTMTIRRRPIYTVSFNTDGGTVVASQQIEEDNFAIEPTTTKSGYTFTGWNYSFNESIDDNIIIKASWVANTDTPYKVEYYLENLAGNYTLQETEYLTGTTDTMVNADIKIYEHFIPISDSVTGKIKGHGSTVLSVYYNLETFTVNILADTGVTLNCYYHGSFKYGHNVPQISATETTKLLGYRLCWFDDNEFMTNNNTIPSFIVDRSVNYIAKQVAKEEMINFNFVSTTNTCCITGIKDITITDTFIPSYVTDINSDAFNRCSDLINISVDINNTNYKSIDGDLYGKDGKILVKYAIGKTTTTFSIPNGVTNIEDYVFHNCSSLSSIAISDSVTSIESKAFSNCTALTNISVSKDNPNYSSQDGVLYNKNKTELIAVPSGISGNLSLSDSLITIGSYAFSECINLTSVTLGNSVKSIKELAFVNCGSLTSIIISNSVTIIEINAFYDCNNLNEVTFNNASGWQVSKYSDMFNAINLDCEELENKYTAAHYLKSVFQASYWQRA